MKIITIVVLTGAVMISLPGRAEARQSFLKDNVVKMIRKAGVHLNTSYREPIDSDVTKGASFGASIGLSPGRTNGWRYPVGITMFDENLHGPNGQQFALLRSRAIMAGIGYGWHFGRLSTGVSLQVGYAVNSARPQGDVPAAFDMPGAAISMHADNSPLLRPQIKAEYFITPKFTFRVSGDYMMIKPDITVTTPVGTISDRWNASNLHANVGIGYYPFRK